MPLNKRSFRESFSKKYVIFCSFNFQICISLTKSVFRQKLKDVEFVKVDPDFGHISDNQPNIVGFLRIGALYGSIFKPL